MIYILICHIWCIVVEIDKLSQKPLKIENPSAFAAQDKYDNFFALPHNEVDEKLLSMLGILRPAMELILDWIAEALLPKLEYSWET